MLVYVLKSAACLAILLAFYKFFLEKENMHTLKRFFLLGSLLAALTIPFITFVEYVELPIATEMAPMEIMEVPVGSAAIQEPEPLNYTLFALWGIYALGAFLFAFKFARNLSNIIGRIRKNPKYTLRNITNVLLTEHIAPHTFLNFIFLNKQKFETQQIPKEVLLHEETHAKQKHSLDVLFIEFLQVVFWFNPLIHLAKKAIKLNHEFLADQAVLKNGIQPAAYQNTLLEFSSNSLHPQLANAINYSSIKKRFTVMKTKTSKKSIVLRSLFFLPILTLLFYGFSEAKVVHTQPSETQMTSDQNETNVKTELQTISAGNDSIKFIKDWFITIEGQKYYYLRDANRVWHYYDSTKKEVYLDIVVEYKKKYNKFYNLKNNGTHYIDKSKKEQMILDGLFSDLGGMYFRMSHTNRQKIKRPISPYAPYLRFVKNGQTVFKKPNDLTEEDKKFIPSRFQGFPEEQKAQEGATKKQLKEYNTLAKKYNAMSRDNFIVIGKELNQLQHIYGHMTEQQRKKAESFPNFPPPPSSPKVTKQIKSTIPPPPPPSHVGGEIIEVPAPNATPVIHKGEILEVPSPSSSPNLSASPVKVGHHISPTLPPPPPKSPKEHMMEMAKKGAIFYLEGKEISSDKALKILKESKKINVRTRHEGLERPIVELSTSPLVIEPQ